MAEYLERGASAEREALSTLSAALPEPLRDALPDRLREALTTATAPTAAAPGAPGAPGSSFSSVVAPEGWTSSNGAKPVATWTFSGSDDEGYGPAVVITAAELTASQTGAWSAAAAAALCGGLLLAEQRAMAAARRLPSGTGPLKASWPPRWSPQPDLPPSLTPRPRHALLRSRRGL